MLSIRLTRTGKAHDPHYRIVVQEKRSKLNGKVVDTIGHYHPTSPDKLLVIDKVKAAKWLSQGAQPSDTVANMLVKQGLLDPSRKVTHFYTAKPKEDKPEVKAPVKEEVVAEEPVAEVAAVETPATEDVVAAEPVTEEPIVAEEEVATEEVVTTEEAAPAETEIKTKEEPATEEAVEEVAA